MLLKMMRRFLREPDRRLLRNFIVKFGWQGMRAVQHYQRRLRRGEYFPAFLFLSLTDRCNLTCQGCWVTQCDPPRMLEREVVERVIDECCAQGSKFFGVMGGEPLLYDGLTEVFDAHPDCYFLMFTNGTLLTEEVASDLKRAGNVTPLISIEGLEQVSDERRGSKDVFKRSMQGIENCRKQGLITGVATSVCRNNIDDLASEEFLQDLIRRGVLYVWYYIYRPVGPDPQPDLALTREQVLQLRRFIVENRSKYPIMIVDSYWDHEGRALCPAVVGIANHIGPGGGIEPCPPIQFATDNIGDGRSMKEAFEKSRFLREFGSMVSPHTRGCIIMEAPDVLRSYVDAHGAKDTSGRGTAMAELSSMTCRCSHHIPGCEIPEKSWMYRFAKKHWFFGFGAYG